MRSAILAAVLLASVAPTAMAQGSGQPAPAQRIASGATVAAEAQLTALIADFEAYESAEDPLTAGQEGDAAALSRWPEFTPAAAAPPPA